MGASSSRQSTFSDQLHVGSYISYEDRRRNDRNNALTMRGGGGEGGYPPEQGSSAYSSASSPYNCEEGMMMTSEVTCSQGDAVSVSGETQECDDSETEEDCRSSQWRTTTSYAYGSTSSHKERTLWKKLIRRLASGFQSRMNILNDVRNNNINNNNNIQQPVVHRNNTRTHRDNDTYESCETGIHANINTVAGHRTRTLRTSSSVLPVCSRPLQSSVAYTDDETKGPVGVDHDLEDCWVKRTAGMRVPSITRCDVETNLSGLRCDKHSQHKLTHCDNNTSRDVKPSQPNESDVITRLSGKQSDVTAVENTTESDYDTRVWIPANDCGRVRSMGLARSITIESDNFHRKNDEFEQESDRLKQNCHRKNSEFDQENERIRSSDSATKNDAPEDRNHISNSRDIKGGGGGGGGEGGWKNGTNVTNISKIGGTTSLPLRTIQVQASSSELLTCVGDFLQERCYRLRHFHSAEAVVWMRSADQALNAHGWQDTPFINPANVVFLFMLLRTAVDSKVVTLRELQGIVLTCLYLAFTYMGNEISYPLKPFLVEPDEDRKRFWHRCLRIASDTSAMMLRINADPLFFTALFRELKAYSYRRKLG